MNAKVLSTFLEAAVEVLTTEIGGPIERGQVSMVEASCPSNDVNVLLNVVGRLQGVVVYEMSTQTALKFVSRMIGQEMLELDDLAQSGIAELGNVITGRAGTLLGATDYAVSLSVPTLVIGRATISTLDFRRIVVPLTTKDGVLEVHLALREAPAA